jgi:hypothetical protein
VCLNKIRRHVEENGGSPTRTGNLRPFPPQTVTQSCGLSSFKIDGSSAQDAAPQFTGTTSHAVSKTASRGHQAASVRASQEPPKIKLFLQKTDGEIDFQNPLPSTKFKDTTVPKFFAMFSERAGLDVGLLESLTFVVVFAKENLEVKRSDDEKMWFNLKRRIKHLLKEATRGRPPGGEFEVWVVEDYGLADL